MATPTSKKNETGAASNLTSSGRQRHVRAAIGPWDIKMPPIRKHMLGGHLVPTLGTTTRLFNQKRRRVALEILEPLDDKKGYQLPTYAWNPDNETLQDHDQIVLRFFRRVRKKMGGDSDDDDGTYEIFKVVATKFVVLLP